MIVLNATDKTLQVLLGGSVTTNQLPIVATYVDVTTTTYTPGASDTVSNNTTAVTVVAAPGASTERQVKLLTVYNADTVAATVIVRYNNNGTTRVMCRADLEPGSTLVYMDGEGFRVLTENGAVLGLGEPGADAAPFIVFMPGSDNAPASSPATFDVRNGNIVLDFRRGDR